MSIEAVEVSVLRRAAFCILPYHNVFFTVSPAFSFRTHMKLT